MLQEDDVQTFPMVDVPDDQLDEEGKKEKRKQKLLKSNYDARMRMKAEKKAEKARVAEEKRKDEESRAADPEAWAARLREDHAVSRRILGLTPRGLLTDAHGRYSRPRSFG